MHVSNVCMSPCMYVCVYVCVCACAYGASSVRHHSVCLCGLCHVCVSPCVCVFVHARGVVRAPPLCFFERVCVLGSNVHTLSLCGHARACLRARVVFCLFPGQGGLQERARGSRSQGEAGGPPKPIKTYWKTD